jgi:GTP-binding protein
MVDKQGAGDLGSDASEPTQGSARSNGDDDQAAAIELGRWLFAQTCSFLVSAAAAEQLPAPALPEIAFAGRSNVGKSSLVNALTGRKTLARTSNTPGRTRQLNLFELGGRLLLADLPGYGYARAAKGDIKQWTGLTRAYLKGRPNLRRVCLLVDARHGIKDSDRAIMAVLDTAAVSYQIILTKADKADSALAGVQVEAAAEVAKRPAAHPEILATSARTGAGIAELRAALAALAERGGPE